MAGADEFTALSTLIDALTVALETATDPEEREELAFLLAIQEEQIDA